MIYAIYSNAYPKSDCLGLVNASSYREAIDSFADHTNVCEVVCEYDDLVAEDIPMLSAPEGVVITTSDSIDYI